MEFKTKYNIGDEVWCKCNNNAYKVIIVNISAFSCSTDKHITYGVRDSEGFYYYPEESIFPTKEELLKSL